MLDEVTVGIVLLKTFYRDGRYTSHHLLALPHNGHYMLKRRGLKTTTGHGCCKKMQLNIGGFMNTVHILEPLEFFFHG